MTLIYHSFYTVVNKRRLVPHPYAVRSFFYAMNKRSLHLVALICIQNIVLYLSKILKKCLQEVWNSLRSLPGWKQVGRCALTSQKSPPPQYPMHGFTHKLPTQAMSSSQCSFPVHSEQLSDPYTEEEKNSFD